jgi:hypothetical protein
MRLPRLTTRRLMATVAVVGILCYGIILAQRSVQYSRLALSHARGEVHSRSKHRSKASTASAGREQAAMWRRRARETGSKTAAEAALDQEPGIAMYEAAAQAASLKADYHAALSRKYRRAARRPWLAVPPDPPPE